MISVDQMCRVPAWFGDSGPESEVVTSTRIRLARNLSGHQFPERCSLRERKEIFETVEKSCGSSPELKNLTATNFASLRPLNQQFLMEERAVSPDLLRIEGDRGMIGDPDLRVSILVNEEDHLRLQVMDSGLCAEALWNRADSLDNILGESMRFAYDRRRGFLTACPTNAGTGLRVSFLMHLPGLALTKSIDQVLQSASQMGVSTRGFFGEHSEIVGTFFQLSNQATMGATEGEFLESTLKLARHVVDLERHARQRLLCEARTELTDKVCRAFGILTHARTFSVHEFLNLSSAARIGIDNGILKGITRLDLNRLTLVIMPAHIRTLYDRQMDDNEVAAVRAEIVRTFLKQKVVDLST